MILEQLFTGEEIIKKHGSFCPCGDVLGPSPLCPNFFSPLSSQCTLARYGNHHFSYQQVPTLLLVCACVCTVRMCMYVCACAHVCEVCVCEYHNVMSVSQYRVHANRTHDPITARKFNSKNCLYSTRTEATVRNYFL